MAENLTEHAPLVISPQELIFPPPLNRVITNILKLHNNSAKPVSYKIKTTARKRYCVRPNTGVVNPKETVEVQILLNFSKDQTIDPKTKDKFQVQSIYLEPEQITQDLKAVWGLVPEESIMKQKLKCYFSSKPGANPTPLVDSTQPRFAPTIPRSLSKDDSQDEYDEPKTEVIPEIRSPITQPKSQVKQPDLFVSALPIEESVIPAQNQSDSREKRQEEAIKTVSRQLGAVTSERDEYKKEIAQLREKINQLEALRQRKPVVTADTGVTTKQMEVFEQQTNLRLIQLLIVAIVFFLLGRYSS